MKVVVDTNVLYAAFVSTQGTCAYLVELLIRARAVVLSDHILQELQRHLRGKQALPAELVNRQIRLLMQSATLVVPTPVAREACDDPDDLPVLGTLLAADADCLVTGDRVLLDLGRFSGREILSPRQLLDRLGCDGLPH